MNKIHYGDCMDKITADLTSFGNHRLILFLHQYSPTEIHQPWILFCISAGCLLNILLLFPVAMVTPPDFLPRGQAGVTVSYSTAALPFVSSPSTSPLWQMRTIFHLDAVTVIKETKVRDGAVAAFNRTTALSSVMHSDGSAHENVCAILKKGRFSFTADVQQLKMETEKMYHRK